MNRLMDSRLSRRSLLWGALAMAALQGSALTARAELLIEEKNQAGAPTTADSVVEAQAAPVQQIPVAQVAQVAVPAQAYPVQPVVIQAPAAADPADKMSRTDLVRRERMREELRNEDILQERLEELRLQDEKRRTGQVLGVSPEAAAPAAPLLAMQQPAAPAVAAPVVTEQVGSVPVTDRPGQAAGSSVSSLSTSLADEPAEEVTTLRLTPRAGLPGFQGQSPYLLQGRYSLGAGIDVGVSDHLTFELGYGYSEYGVALNSATALGLTPILGGGGYGFNYNQNNTTGVLKQNVVDAGLKIHLLGRRSKLRPFIGGGAGYSRSYLNYDARIVDFLNRMGYGVSPDYDLTQFLASASAGVELQLSKSVVVGLTYKYFTVLSSRQNQELYNPALYGAYPGALYGGYGYPYGTAGGLADLDKQLVGGSIADTSFYSVMGTVGFSF
jgi:opacity protein-like surface antigen